MSCFSHERTSHFGARLRGAPINNILLLLTRMDISNPAEVLLPEE